MDIEKLNEPIALRASQVVAELEQDISRDILCHATDPADAL